MSTESKSGEFVNVGDELGFEAQYLSKDGSTYVSEGKIYAAIPGYLKIDEKHRTIIVDPKNEADRVMPKPGDYVTGQIYMIRRHSIGVKILTLNNKLVNDMGYIGNLHISKIANRYIKKIENVFTENDFIRAKILKRHHAEYRLATDEPHLGVIKTYCKYCGHQMTRKSRDQVVCPFCNHYERKVLAKDFNDIEMVLDL